MHIDHIIFAVADRDEAGEDFGKLGFKAVIGGTHADGNTHNRLCVLADGVYLELCAPTDKASLNVQHEDNGKNWLYVYNAGEGYAGYAILTHEIETIEARLRARGYPLNDKKGSGRVLPDGREPKGKSVTIIGKRYPAIVQDISPRGWRVPSENGETEHPNGVVGVQQVIALVRDLEEGARRHEDLLGIAPQPGSYVEGAKTADFPVEGALITIAAPADTTSTVYQEVTKRGEVPYLIRLKTTKPERRGMLDLNTTHLARIELV
jgi:hypothetical protein